ncbi:MAG: hypothetical protein EOO41_02505 [Methanobacteriota archaeon]|nr:MAG: hypothetical protein EOO41_02505 [Euryarchaeota archaeon]
MMGIMARASPHARNAFLDAGALSGVLRFLSGGSKPSLAKASAHTLCAFLQGKRSPAVEHVEAMMPAIDQLLHDHEDVALLTDVLRGLVGVTEGEGYDLRQEVVTAGVCSHLPGLLRHASAAVAMAALQWAGNMVSGNEGDTRAVVSAGVLPILVHMLASPEIKVCRAACWAVSNVMAGTPSQIQAVLATGVLPTLMDLLQSKDTKLRRSAGWALSNAALEGAHAQRLTLLRAGCMRALIQVVRDNDDESDWSSAMQGIDSLLTSAQKSGNASLLATSLAQCRDADLPRVLASKLDHRNKCTCMTPIHVHAFLSGLTRVCGAVCVGPCGRTAACGLHHCTCVSLGASISSHSCAHTLCRVHAQHAPHTGYVVRRWR